MKIRQVAIKVAMVMPDTGLEEVPMMPTIRLATVTKKKPNTMMSTPISSLPKTEVPGTKGSSAMTMIRPDAAGEHHRDGQVLLGPLGARGRRCPRAARRCCP